MDQYQPGSAHIDNMNCGDGGCEARGHFSFFRGGTRLTITFDDTTGMRDCVQ